MRLVQKIALAALAGAALLTAAPAATAGDYGVSAACPSGTRGVVVSSGSSSTYVCSTAVSDVTRIVQSLEIDIACDICPPK